MKMRTLPQLFHRRDGGCMQINELVPLSMRIQKSLKEYLIDYLIIIILLVIVAVICIIIYAVMSGIAEVSLLQSNLLSFFTRDRKSTRLNSSHVSISYAVFCLKKII